MQIGQATKRTWRNAENGAVVALTQDANGRWWMAWWTQGAPVRHDSLGFGLADADYAASRANGKALTLDATELQSTGRQFCRKCRRNAIPAVTLTFDGGTRRLHWCDNCVSDADAYRSDADQPTPPPCDSPSPLHCWNDTHRCRRHADGDETTQMASPLAAAAQSTDGLSRSATLTMPTDAQGRKLREAMTMTMAGMLWRACCGAVRPTSAATPP